MEFSLACPLIGEARRRQRVRRRRLALVLLTAVALAVAVTGALRQGPAAPITTAPQLPGVAQPAWTVLSRAPYMGVACRVASATGCDRVGLAVWLRRPASSVHATVDGRALTLRRFGNPRTRGTEFAGYVRRAGLASRLGLRRVPGTSIWRATRTPRTAVRLVIGEPVGGHVVTRLRVPLMAGWG